MVFNRSINDTQINMAELVNLLDGDSQLEANVTEVHASRPDSDTC